MDKNKEFINFIIEKLDNWKYINNRTVFGGEGLFVGSIMFCLIQKRTIYMVVDEKSVLKYKEMQSKPFVHGITSNTKDYSTLFSLPDSILLNREKFIEWANESYQIGKRKILLGEKHID